MKHDLPQPRIALELAARVHETIERENMLAEGESVLVGVSGGPDSVALVRLLASIAERHKTGWKLHLGHLHHGIRGADADEDAEFVRRLAERMGLPLASGKTDVPEAARRERLSTEDAARRARYAFLEKSALEHSCTTIACGHNADDQAETVLLNLARGAGVDGLRGMQPVRAIRPGRNVKLVRPLLEIRRNEILLLLDSIGQDYRTDPSNTSTDYARNRLRHRVLPVLRDELNPDVDSAILRLASHVRILGDFIDEQAESALGDLESSWSDGELRIDAEGFGNLAEALRFPVLKKLLWSGTPPQGQPPPTGAHVLDRIANCLSSAGPEHMGKGWTARREGKHLIIGRGQRIESSRVEATQLPVPGRIELRDGKLSIRAQLTELNPGDLPRFLSDKTPTEEMIDAEAAGGELTVRSRKRGDLFQPLGMTGTKKLKEFFREREVPKSKRDAWPLVVGAGGIVWVVGLGIAHWARVTLKTKNAVILHAEGLQD